MKKIQFLRARRNFLTSRLFFKKNSQYAQINFQNSSALQINFNVGSSRIFPLPRPRSQSPHHPAQPGQPCLIPSLPPASQQHSLDILNQSGPTKVFSKIECPQIMKDRWFAAARAHTYCLWDCHSNTLKQHFCDCARKGQRPSLYSKVS